MAHRVILTETGGESAWRAFFAELRRLDYVERHRGAWLQDGQDAEYLAWSAVHGLALLVLEGPLYQMPQEMVQTLGERLVTMVERGLN